MALLERGKGEGKNARQTELVHQEKGTGIWGLQAGQVEQVVNILIACEGPEAPAAVLGLSWSTGVSHQLLHLFSVDSAISQLPPSYTLGRAGGGEGERETGRERKVRGLLESPRGGGRPQFRSMEMTNIQLGVVVPQSVLHQGCSEIAQ